MNEAVVGDLPSHVPPELAVNFDMYHIPGAELDFHRAWNNFQKSAPGDLVWSICNGGHWIPLRGALVKEVMGDTAHFASSIIAVPRDFADAVSLIPQGLDPPRHAGFRALINPWLSPKSIVAREAFIRRVAVERIDQLRENGKCEFVQDYAFYLPIRIFMDLVDLPMEETPRLKKIISSLLESGLDGEGATGLLDQLRAFIRPFIIERQKSPGPDMLSGFANATVSGKPIVFNDAVDLGVQLLMAGLDTVAALFGFVMHFLARNPAHCKELVDDPSLIPGAADEFLRRFGMVTNAREVVEDYEFYGVRLAKGDIISAPTFIYGMDEREFEDPMSINFRRSAGEHTTFGHGRHRCPGSFLARAELRITLEEWLARIPEFRVDVDQPVHMHAGISGGLDQLHLRWD